MVVKHTDYVQLENNKKIHGETCNGPGALSVKIYFPLTDYVEGEQQDVDSKDSIKITVMDSLLTAAREGNLNEIKRLGSLRDVDVSKPHRGVTAICMAASHGHLDIVKYLVEEKGVDPNQTEDEGTSLVHAAANNGRLKIVKYLVEEANVQDPNKPDTYGKTPLMYAAENGHLNVVKYLVETAGAKILNEDKDGESPLIFASEEGHLDVVQYLVSKGADPNKQDTRGYAPINFADANGHHDVVEYLRSIN